MHGNVSLSIQVHTMFKVVKPITVPDQEQSTLLATSLRIPMLKDIFQSCVLKTTPLKRCLLLLTELTHLILP